MFSGKLLTALLAASLLASCGGQPENDRKDMARLGGPAPDSAPAQRVRMGLGAGETELLVNPGFEGTDAPWVANSEVLATDQRFAHGGTRFAWLGGYNNAKDYVYQDLEIPARAKSAKLRFWYYMVAPDPVTAPGGDIATVTIEDAATGATLAKVLGLSNAYVQTSWTQIPAFDLLPYKGRKIRLRVAATTDGAGRSDFVFDDFTLAALVPPPPSEILVLPERRRDYALVNSGDGLSIYIPREGNKNLETVKRITFSDSALAFDTDGIPGQLYRLYRAAFAREPDLGGLGYWISVAEGSNLPLLRIAESFIDSAEFKARYGTLADQDFVTQAYRNVLNRSPDTAGLDYWTGLLTKGALSRAQVLGSFADSPENRTQVASAIQYGVAYVPPSLIPADCGADKALVNSQCEPRPTVYVGPTLSSGGSSESVPTNAEITAHFSIPMDAITLAPGKVTVTPAISGYQEAWSNDKTTWRLQPDTQTGQGQLLPGTRYTVTVAADLRATNGTTLGSVKSFYFKTAATCGMGVLSAGACVPQVCRAPQLLGSNWLCYTPFSCPVNLVLENSMCVSKREQSCTLPKILDRSVCVLPAASCVAPFTLERGLCVRPVNYQELGPLVKSTQPANGWRGISGTYGGTPVRTVSVMFDEDIDSRTLNAQSFRVRLSGGADVPGVLSYEGRTATFTANDATGLPPGSYSVELSSPLRDTWGRPLKTGLYAWSFQLGSTITVTPAPDSESVAVTTTLGVTFGLPMTPSSINAQSFLVSDGGRDGNIAGSVSASGNTAGFRPTSRLPAGTTIYAVLTTEVKDAAGNPLPKEYRWQFKTYGPAGCTPPQVLVNGLCQTPVVCAAPKVLQNGVCVTPGTTTPGGSTTPDADGCFVPRHNPECLVIESNTVNSSFYHVVKYRNNCGARVYATMCNVLRSGREDCGADGVAAGGLKTWYSYDSTGQAKYRYAGSTNWEKDWVCNGKDPLAKF